MIKLFMMLCFSFISLFANSDELKVGIKKSEPWVMFDNNHSKQPVGFSIDLWNEISKNLDKETKWIYYNNTKEIIEATKKGEIDAGIAAITINSDREKYIDFSHSMYELGLQALVSTDFATPSTFDTFLKEIKKLFTLNGLLYFLLFLFLTINIRWFVDRIEDEKKRVFSSNYFFGIYDAFWWAITMLVTWEAPKNKGLARTLDLSWHIVGLIGFSMLTATVTAALTAKTVGGNIKNEKDLIGKYVAAVETDAPKKYLEKLGAKVVPVKNLDDGIALVREGKVDALVHDGPRLVYISNEINKKEKKKALLVLPFKFNPQNYGIAFPDNSPLVENVNQILLNLREPQGINKSFHEKIQQKWLSNN
ncbi:MAG: transporter substrate-binding domain-containing protein [Campylobacterota bacterium]|nr:transporter substrate-binding domain-containing protein [Campylobacterota bacterium]